MRDDRIVVEWSERIMEGLTNLQNSKYVQLVNQHSMVIKGGYSIRMFEILASERFIGNWDKAKNRYRFTFEIKELMYRLGVTGSYETFQHYFFSLLFYYCQFLGHGW